MVVQLSMCRRRMGKDAFWLTCDTVGLEMQQGGTPSITIQKLWGFSFFFFLENREFTKWSLEEDWEGTEQRFRSESSILSDHFIRRILGMKLFIKGYLCIWHSNIQKAHRWWSVDTIIWSLDHSVTVFFGTLWVLDPSLSLHSTAVSLACLQDYSLRSWLLFLSSWDVWCVWSFILTFQAAVGPFIPR